MQEFHHIGVATNNLDRDTKAFSAQGYVMVGEDFIDPVQGIKGRFLEGGGPRLELVLPLADEGVLTGWLKQGTKFYHLAYEVDSMEQSLENLVGQGGKVVVNPVDAVAFEGRKIAFVMMRNMALIEYIEKG